MDEEKHDKQFRGCWCPAEVLQMVEEDTITAKEMLLLMIVDSLVNHSGEDCFASNEYLARRCHLTPNRMSAVINHLKELGLLTQTSFNGRRRFMKCSWSRLTGNSKADLPEIVSLPYRKQLGYNTSVEHTMSPAAGAAVGTDSLPATNKKPKHPRWHAMAENLAGAIAQVQKINCTSKLSAWARSFELLHTKDGVEVPRMWDALNWYCRELPLRHGDQYFLVIHSGPAFREKFAKLERAMKTSATQGQRASDLFDEPPAEVPIVKPTGRKVHMTPEMIKRQQEQEEE